MNKPRFKIGDKVCCPGFFNNRIITIEKIHDLTVAVRNVGGLPDKFYKNPFRYSFKEEKTGRGAWDFELIEPEIYNSPLWKALAED